MRMLDLMMAFPPIMLVLLILAITPPSLMKTALAIGILSAPPIGRVTRSVTLDLMSGEFMEAARARGERVRYMLRARAAAECLAGADGGGQPARGVRRAAGRGAEFPRLRRAAARRRLGPDDQRLAAPSSTWRRGSRSPPGSPWALP